MSTFTKHGSPAHFEQVVTAHVIGPFGTCACGRVVGLDRPAYLAHIARVWRPYALPAWFGTYQVDPATLATT